MAIKEIINSSVDVLPNVVLEVGKIVLWLQAIGVILVLWIIFQIVAVVVNRKKRKALYSIKSDLARIEKKIDKLSKK